MVMEEPRRRRALIIDDSRVAQMILARLIKASGWDVSEVVGGRQALAYLEHDQPDAVFVDLLMPEMSGLEFLRELQHRGYRLPVVVLTADAQESTRCACRRYPIHAFLRKPARADVISTTLDSIPVATDDQ